MADIKNSWKFVCIFLEWLASVEKRGRVREIEGSLFIRVAYMLLNFVTFYFD